MKKLYLDMKFVGSVPDAYRLSHQELGAVSGMNLGNFVFRHALNFLIDDLQSFKCTTGPEFNESVANEQPEHVLVSCANWLGQTAQDEQFNLGRAKMIEAVDCPVSAFGLGVQSKNMGSDGAIRLGPNSVRLAKALSERANQLSVRDEITRQTLESVGIDNAVVTGCPSNFINCDPQLGQSIVSKARAAQSAFSSWEDMRMAISEYTGGHAASGKILNSHMRMLAETPSFYVLQTPELLPFITGERSNLKDAYRKNNPFMDSWGKLTRTLLAKALHFSSVDAWLDFSRTCDASFGMRIHGTVVTLQAGVPSILVAHDSRTLGLGKTMGVPRMDPDSFFECLDAGPARFFQYVGVKMQEYDATRKTLAHTMHDLLVANGLKPRADLVRLM